MRHNPLRSRPGFTLTELMVALALIILIMSIMAQAFGSASQLIRDLRAANELAERLRGAMTLLRYDLKHPHLGDPQRRLSDGTWAEGTDSSKGFFRITQMGRPVDLPVDKALPARGADHIQPGDSTGIMSRSALHFTVRLPGVYPTDLFATNLTGRTLPFTAMPPPPENPLLEDLTLSERKSAQERRYQQVGGTELRSHWAEVTWWVVPQSGTLTPPDTDPAVLPGQPAGLPARGDKNSQQLFTLRRRQRILWDHNYTTPGPLGPGEPNIPLMPWTVNAASAFPPQPVLVNERRAHRNVSFPNILSQLMISPPPPPPPPVPPPPPPNSVNGFYPNTPDRATMPPLRFGAAAVPHWYVKPSYLPYTGRIALTDSDAPMYAGVSTSPYPTGSDLNDDVPDFVLADVLSFDVRVLLTGSTDFVDLGHPTVQWFNSGNPACNPPITGPYDRPFVFDTWTKKSDGRFDYESLDATTFPRWQRYGSHTAIPLYRRWVVPPPPPPPNPPIPPYWDGDVIKIRAIQITLRIWDEKSSFARQVTLVQEL